VNALGRVRTVILEEVSMRRIVLFGAVIAATCLLVGSLPAALEAG